MLEIKTTSITLMGNSLVEVDGNQVQTVNMHAVVNEYGNSSVSTNIINQELYEKNKAACRSDIDAFTAKVREIEDAGIESLAE